MGMIFLALELTKFINALFLQEIFGLVWTTLFNKDRYDNLESTQAFPPEALKDYRLT